ncbi:hypothetical protein AB6E21_06185 [Photobacterium swingsii]|uniref:hypothetical protein n=1 Tax=Photobacterium swingsii TaxID=680026 RepID=UPI00355202A1
MKNIKKYILPTVISTVLIGCGGSDESYSSFDEQKVTYDVENIVESFLGSNIDYAVKYKSKGYAGELVKYYDKNGNIVDFKIPTNTIANHGCKAEALSLDSRKFNNMIDNNSTYFNVKPLSNNQRLVIVSSFPTVFTNKYLGNTSCRYGNYTFNKKYIIGKSNEKLIELDENESMAKKTPLLKLSQANRLLNRKYLSKTNQNNGKVTANPYSSSIINISTHEFIVNKNGEVKTYDKNSNKYVSLPNTKGTEWQFYSDRFLISKAYGGTAIIYDVTAKKRLNNASISVLQNLDTNLKNIEEATLSYGLVPNAGGQLINSNNETIEHGTPYKIVSSNYNSKTYVYLLEKGQWKKSKFELGNDISFLYLESKLEQASAIASSYNDAFIEPESGTYFATKDASNSGFKLAIGYSGQEAVIPDFSNYLDNVHIINNKFVVETSTRIFDYEERAFYLIDGKTKKIIGAPSEMLTMINASAHN